RRTLVGCPEGLFGPREAWCVRRACPSDHGLLPVRTSDVLASLFDATASARLCWFLASRGAAEWAPANAIAISPPAMMIPTPALALSQRSNVTRSSEDRVR